MRIRLLLSGAALTAAALLGTTAATAHAAPSGGTGSAVSVAAGYWKKIGRYSYADCVDLRDSYAGEAQCRSAGGGRYDLWIWVP
ncbi:hypothetical protein ABT093_12955 [Kitasatospora sp. NPDC002551]|uniref:hypothetical protein n=1 Tax=unclassified Kitasatospora TaxID=2633591 RepID=UPI00332DEB10